jgi:hypothetical protein
MPDLLPFALALGLAAVHVFGGRLKTLDVLPRHAWLSFAGGTSVAYVFVHLLPEMAHLQEALGGLGGLAGAVERHVWLLALLGLCVFYGLELLVERSREEGGGEASEGVFWVHMGSYGLYNVLIGYLLEWGEGRTQTGVLLFALAMALHFLVNDAALRADHRERYRRVGRWILAGAVLAGCALGLVVDLGEVTIAALLGLLGGSIVLNVLKEELPDDRDSRFWPFALGAAAYSVLLLAV